MNQFARLVLRLFLACALALALVPCAMAQESEAQSGTVLFAARYADYTSLRDTGLRFGSASWDGASMALRDGALALSSASDKKTYLLLPDDIPASENYVLRYSFRFTDIAESNGYCAFLLSSRGDAPSNRSELYVRASGSCDGFGTLPDSMAKRIAAGETVTVTVPIRHGILHEITVAVGGESETFRLAQLRSVSAGGRGFSLRNASADILSVEIVQGDGTAAPIGPYANRSYIAPPEWNYSEPSAPTGEGDLPLLFLAALSAIGAWRMRHGLPYRIPVRRKN